MIYEEIMYGLKCDRCHETYEDGEGGTVSSDKYRMEEYANDDDWHTTEDGRHYCPNCYTKTEDNEIIPKPLIYGSFFEFWRMLNQLSKRHHSFSEDENYYYLTSDYCYHRLKDAIDEILREIIKEFAVEYKEPEKKSGGYECNPYEVEIVKIPKNFKHIR